MAVVAIIKRGSTNVPTLVERIQKGDEFCFVVNQKTLPWHIAPATGRDNLTHFATEIRAVGGDPCAAPIGNSRQRPIELEGRN